MSPSTSTSTSTSSTSNRPNIATRASEPVDATAVATQLRSIVAELAERFYERDDVIRSIVTAMLAGQHSLLLGPPGTAKSELARELTARISDARLWEILLSKFTAPTRMFGPVDVAALTRGEYRQVFDGRATDCDIAFIDEIFKCSTAALNETLSLLNERLYHPEAGGQPIACPLISAICASNELPTGEDAAAIYDRLLVRLEVGYLADPSNFAALVQSAVAKPAAAAPTTISLPEFQHAVTVAVPAVAVGDGIVDAICTLRASLRRHELIASDRRWRQSVRLLQASAFLDGRDEVNDNDLAILAHVLWEKLSDRNQVEREVLQLINPDAKEALDIADGIEELAATLDDMAGQAADTLSQWAIKEANKKLSDADKKLSKLRTTAVEAGRSTASLDRVIARRKAVQARVLKEALGVDIASIGDSDA